MEAREGVQRATGVVPGTPRWAVVAAWMTVGCVLPSAVWRTAVGLGVPLGWSDEHLALERIPGFGTLYVIGLSLASTAAAALTLGLVQRWGEVLPRRAPVLGGRRVPVALVVVLAGAGIMAVTDVVVLSVRHWDQVSGFADRSGSGWALLMDACYLPAVLWPVLLLVVTAAHVHRRLVAARVRRPRAPAS